MSSILMFSDLIFKSREVQNQNQVNTREIEIIITILEAP